MSSSRHCLRLVALVSVCASAFTFACGDDDSANDIKRPSLGLYAFPASVAPNAETTIAVVVRGACVTQKNCTLKVGLTPATSNADPGVLFQPGLTVDAGPSGGPLLEILVDDKTNASDEEPLSLVYRAPPAEGSRVVTASLFSANKVIATRTVSIDVTKSTATATATKDSGTDSSDATNDASKDAPSDTSTSDAIVDAGGQ